MNHLYMCVVCGKNFERESVQGNHIQIQKLCDVCIKWHKWCSFGKHAPLRSQWGKSKIREDGLQSCYCSTCLPMRRGSITIRQCAHCSVEFITGGRGSSDTRFNGRSTVALCDHCYQCVKHCKRCDNLKPRNEFGISRDKAHGLKPWCKQCDAERWQERSPQERFAHRSRDKTFDLTHQEWTAMRDAQRDLCAICGQPETTVRQGKVISLAIDHCHDTNRVRALLCQRCNQALGLMMDDPARLRAAADYVERWAAALAD